MTVWPLNPEAPAAPLAAPLSILFILQPRDLVRESKLPLFHVLPAGPAPPPLLPLETALLWRSSSREKLV
jgi:hypothetical protein